MKPRSGKVEPHGIAWPKEKAINLNAPTQIVFLISVVLAIVALLAYLSVLGAAAAAWAFWIALVAWIVLAAGSLFKGM